MAQASITFLLEQWQKSKKKNDKGETCAAISCKYGISKKTLFVWIKGKSKVYEEVGQK